MENAATVTEFKPRKAKARKEGGQEATIKLEVVRDRIAQLVTLHHAASEAATDLSDAVKKCAEDAGLNAAAVRSFVKARAGDKFEDRKRQVGQLTILFEEVGG